MNRETRIGTDYGRSAKRFLALASALFLLPAFSQDIAVYRNRISGDQSFRIRGAQVILARRSCPRCP